MAGQLTRAFGDVKQVLKRIRSDDEDFPIFQNAPNLIKTDYASFDYLKKMGGFLYWACAFLIFVYLGCSFLFYLVIFFGLLSSVFVVAISNKIRFISVCIFYNVLIMHKLFLFLSYINPHILGSRWAWCGWISKNLCNAQMFFTRFFSFMTWSSTI